MSKKVDREIEEAEAALRDLLLLDDEEVAKADTDDRDDENNYAALDAASDEGDEDDQEDDADDDAAPDDDQDDADEDLPESEKLSKADEEVVVDAAPILAAIEEKLGALERLEAGLKALARHNMALAKAIQADAARPLAPRSRIVKVPTPQKKAAINPGAVLAKAEQAATTGKMNVADIAMFETLVNSEGVEKALELMPHVKALVAE